MSNFKRSTFFARPNLQDNAPPREGELVGAKEGRSSEFILARVIQYLPTKQRYIVADADPTLGPGQKPRSVPGSATTLADSRDRNNRQFQVSMSEIMPMRRSDVEHPLGAHVYAVFPDTSTLYLVRRWARWRLFGFYAFSLTHVARVNTKGNGERAAVDASRRQVRAVVL